MRRKVLGATLTWEQKGFLLYSAKTFFKYVRTSARKVQPQGCEYLIMEFWKCVVMRVLGKYLIFRYLHPWVA